MSDTKDTADAKTVWSLYSHRPWINETYPLESYSSGGLTPGLQLPFASPLLWRMATSTYGTSMFVTAPLKQQGNGLYANQKLMDYENVVYIHHGILFKNKKKQSKFQKNA